jgi:predicted metal-dependent peptidase
LDKNKPYKHPDFPHLSEDELVEISKNFDLEYFLVLLIHDYPFFSHICRKMNKKKIYTIDTIGVGFSGGCLNLIYNPYFLSPYSVKKEDRKKIIGILVHEILHVCLGHINLRKKNPHHIWNIAADLYINSTISKEMLPDCGFKPGYPLKFEKSENQDQNEMNEKLSNFVKNVEPMLSSERYFSLLMDLLPESKGIASGFDNHEEWLDNEQDAELANAKVKQIVREAFNEARNSDRWGKISQEIKKEIEKFAFGIVDWKSVLRNFVGTAMRNDKQNSIHRLNKKYPGIYSGTKVISKPRIAVYVDQSGSVSDTDLSLIFKELTNLSKLTSFHVFNFDTEVDISSEMIWTKEKTIKANRTRVGGTDFSAPHMHYLKEGRFEGMIVLTDGQAEKPPSARYKRAFVLIPNQNLAFDKDNRDIVINMKK